MCSPVSEELNYLLEKSWYKDCKSMCFLYHAISAIQPQLIVEHGTKYGCSAMFMAKALTGGKIITIDMFTETTPSGPSNAESIIATAKQHGVEDKINVITGSTFESGKHVRGVTNDRVDFLFLDASHFIDTLQKEWQSIKHKLADRHVIIVDDIIPESGGASDFFFEIDMNYYATTNMFHNGMGILATHWADIDHIVDCIKLIQ